MENRVSTIMEFLPPDRWHHVSGVDNPADCTSRGLFPAELLQHTLWWNRPAWLQQSPTNWPTQLSLPPNDSVEEEREVSLHVETSQASITPFDRYSSFTRLKRVTAWIVRFVENCRKQNAQIRPDSSLSVGELHKAER